MTNLEKTVKEVIKKMEEQRKSLLLDLFVIEHFKNAKSTIYNFNVGRMLEKIDFAINTLKALLEYNKKNKP